MLNIDAELGWLLGGIVALLIVASVVGRRQRALASGEAAKALWDNIVARTRSWWLMMVIFAASVLVGKLGSVALFCLMSFMALREFITLTPTRAGDHRTLFWVFFIITPAHYLFLAESWYGMFAIFIPVYAFLFTPVRSVLSGDCECFLERTAKIQWGLMVCVYCLSHAPALLILDIHGYGGQNAKLLFYFVMLVELNDVLQFVWGKAIGRRKIAPRVSPNKTWEGLLGGGLSTVLLGTLLWWVTPYGPAQAAGMACIVVIMGFFGGLVMSAIKRDRGVKDWGHSIAGHGGIMDRIDSLSFAAPVFFHATRFWYAS